MTVLAAALFMSIGLINLDFSRNWVRGQLLRLAVGVPILLVYAYVEMPPLVFPQAIVLLLFTFIPNTAYSLLVSARSWWIARRVVSMRRTPALPYLAVLGALLAWAGVLVIAPVVDAGGLRNVPDIALTSALPPSADVKHIRVVPEEAAAFQGDKVVGQLGAYYAVGTYNIQVENGKLVWVAPLEFRDPIKWLTRRTSPGVVVVNAELPDAPVDLRQRAPMAYIPSALFNYNLYRHVYFRYGFEQILELTLQIDDRGNPQYLATLGRPTIGWSGHKVTGVVIVDPASGAMTRVARPDFGNLPRWVKRVYPPDLALDYNDWFGRYVHGWWNAHLSERDVHLPARPEVFGLLVAGDQFVWFIDHSSPSTRDASMTGFTYMDTVTGKLTYFTASAGTYNSIGAERALASNPIVKQGRLIPTQPILYNIGGQNTWVVPAVADTGKYQTLGLVQASTGRVFVGNVSSGSPQDDAFAQYRSWLGDRAVGGANGKMRGVIDRFGSLGGRAFFTLRGRRGIFGISDPGTPEVSLARPGDLVSFSAGLDAGGQYVVSDFHNESLGR